MKYIGKIKSFTDLIAWKEGHKLVLEIYKATTEFPKTEAYGLTNQLRRCTVSITSNIAEGFSRQTKKAKSQFYHMAKGSLIELQNQVLIAKDIGYISTYKFKRLAERSITVAKLITGLIKYTKT